MIQDHQLLVEFRIHHQAQILAVLCGLGNLIQPHLVSCMLQHNPCREGNIYIVH